MKKIFQTININVDEQTKSAAFAKGINRTVNLDNVQKILAMIKSKGYRKAEMIQVIEAEKAAANGDITLVDINGTEIKNEDAAMYYLVLDGQHRVVATSLYNEWAKENKKEEIEIPAIVVELQAGETIAEYINEINITKKEWTAPDYVRGAANVNPENKLLQRYKELIKSEKNPSGYSLATLNLIFCGTNTAMSKSDFALLCSGKEEKGIRAKRAIIPAHNLEVGNKFIQICKNKGFEDKDIAKRYLIGIFNGIKTSTASVDKAFDVFEKITENDKAAMFNEKGNLEEKRVNEQFELIRKREGFED